MLHTTVLEVLLSTKLLSVQAGRVLNKVPGQIIMHLVWLVVAAAVLATIADVTDGAIKLIQQSGVE